MTIVLAAIVALWIAAAIVLAFAGNTRMDVERALSSTEPIRVWDGFDAVRAEGDSEDATDRQVA